MSDDFSHAGKVARLHEAKRFIMTRVEADGPSYIGKLVAAWCSSRDGRLADPSDARYAVLLLSETGDVSLDSHGVVTAVKAALPKRVRVA